MEEPGGLEKVGRELGPEGAGAVEARRFISRHLRSMARGGHFSLMLYSSICEEDLR